MPLTGLECKCTGSLFLDVKTPGRVHAVWGCAGARDSRCLELC